MTQMNRLLAASVLASALSLPVMAVADDTKDDGSTLVQMSAEAHRTVDQDSLRMTLGLQVTGKTAQEAQAELNEKMKDAAKLYSGMDNVKVTTGNYNVWKQYPPMPMPMPDEKPSQDAMAEREKHATWQGMQSLVLDGKDKSALLKLAGKLQGKGFAAQGMDFYLSREASDTLRDDLAAEALASIKVRAEKLAKVLDFKTIRYSRIDLGNVAQGGGNYPVPMMARAMMKGAEAAPMPDPVGQAGQTEVTVSVSADVKMSQ